MLRGGLARRHVGGEGFRWRGRNVTRIEGFSDAVFAFAVTLLVVSLEVPKTFEELVSAMRGFFAFAICFALLFFVWYDHYKFFARYGLSDRPIVRLNGALLFIVLFYVYPMKFLFTLLTDQLLGFSERVRLPGGGSVEMIETSQGPALMMVYGGGFIALQLIFALLYWRAYSLRDALDLDAYELSVTREEVQGYLLNTVIGLASVAVAVVGGPGAVPWAGAIYVLIFPVQIINGRTMSSLRKKQGVTARSAGEGVEAREDPDAREP